MSNGVTPEAPVLLRAARERIARPERWTKGSFPKSPVSGRSMGSSPASWSEDTCLCVDAAVMFERYRTNPLGNVCCGAGLCLSLVARAHGFETASRFNDAAGTTHADVLALLDEASALAESMLLEPT